MKRIKELPDAEKLRNEMSLSENEEEKRRQTIEEIQAVLEGKSKRKILCIGPCSADNEKAVLDYMLRLANLNDEVRDKLLIVPRVYTSKPRTNGTGYKGFLHRQNAIDIRDDIYDGIKATRHMHISVIHETGMYCADEMLYPEASYYILDLLVYVAVGARSVEDQQHRLVASGLDVPVGMKNPTRGDVDVMLNAIVAAQNPQSYLYHGWECESDGNKYVHGILRGYMNSGGKPRPNYHYEMLCDIHDRYVMKNLKNVGVIVDCNHNNSRKHYDEQIRISKEVLFNCHYNKGIDDFVKGLMIESYIEDGSQMIGEGIYGKSITDPCLGWEKTERLIKELADEL